MATLIRPLAVVTGASSGIGLELAKCCAAAGFDLVIAADEEQIHEVARTLRKHGVNVDPVLADLATEQGVEALYAAAQGRTVSALLANAGRSLGQGFLDQNFERVRGMIDTNVTGTLYTVHRFGRDMRSAGRGRILVVASTASAMPSAFQAVYNGTEALLVSFAYALRNELKDSGVTVTCLMPGPTDTEFFGRAGMLDTKVGTEKKQSASEVARIGFEAMMEGRSGVVAGFWNKVQATLAHVWPNELSAAEHARDAEPGGAKH